jgi:hypothetical protein
MSASDFVKNTIGDVFGGLGNRVTLRDWQHASRVFVPGGMGNAPKVKFMFHTYFNINEDAWQPPTGKNYGILVREIKLPSFKFDTSELNQYNRKRIIQTKIKYDPINVTFHDDNMSQVTAMWNAYYQYYYADSWNPSVNPFATQPALKNYNRRNIYDPSITGDQEYGYRGGSTNSGQNPDYPNFGSKIPFFKDITVYGLWANNFIAYTLINPIITNFSHDTYNYSEGGGTMTNQMTIDYETVVYNTGQIDTENPDEFITGFGESAHFDKAESPLAQGAPNDIFSIQQRMEEIIGSDLSAAQKAAELAKLAKEFNLDAIKDNAENAIQNGISSAIRDAIFGGPETNATANSPTNGSTPTIINIANQGVTTGANNNRNTVGGTPTAGGQVTGIQDAARRATGAVIDTIFGG